MLEKPWALEGFVTGGPPKVLASIRRRTLVILRHRRAVLIYAEWSEHDEERQALILDNPNWAERAKYKSGSLL